MEKMLIIIRGPSGAGKTAVAKALAKKLGRRTAYVPLDLTTENLLFGNAHLKFPAKDIIGLIYDNGEGLVKNMLSFGLTVVTEGMFSFRDSSRSRLQRMIRIGKSQNARVVVFDLTADLETLGRRAKNRARNDDEATNYSMVRQRYDTFQKHPYRKSVKIDTTGLSPGDVLAEILDHVTK